MRDGVRNAAVVHSQEVGGREAGRPVHDPALPYVVTEPGQFLLEGGHIGSAHVPFKRAPEGSIRRQGDDLLPVDIEASAPGGEGAPASRATAVIRPILGLSTGREAPGLTFMVRLRPSAKSLCDTGAAVRVCASTRESGTGWRAIRIPALIPVPARVRAASRYNAHVRLFFRLPAGDRCIHPAPVLLLRREPCRRGPASDHLQHPHPRAVPCIR